MAEPSTTGTTGPCDECRATLPGVFLILTRNGDTDQQRFCDVECLGFWAVNHVEPDE